MIYKNLIVLNSVFPFFFAYNPFFLQLEKKSTGIIFILQSQIQLHIQEWNVEILSPVSPLCLFFKRPHHETLNTQNTTGTEIILTILDKLCYTQ